MSCSIQQNNFKELLNTWQESCAWEELCQCEGGITLISKDGYCVTLTKDLEIIDPDHRLTKEVKKDINLILQLYATKTCI